MDTSVGKFGVAVFCAVLVAFGQVHSQASLKERAVLVKGGTFQMGIAEAEIPGLQQKFNVGRAEMFREASPRHSVKVSDFYMDRTEVTNAAFKKFLDKSREWHKDTIALEFHNGKYLQTWLGNDFPAGEANFPVVFVNWHAATAYCRSVGKRLPTEAEWEYSARGGLPDKLFPWGDEMPEKALLNFGASGHGKAIAVASYKPNRYGLFDMAGNVWEYLADEWRAYEVANSVQADPVAAGDRFDTGQSFRSVKTRRVIRGGSYGAGPVNLLVTYRDSHMPNNAGDHVGFRCASSVVKKTN